MDYMNTLFFNLIKDIKPEIKEKIQANTKLIARNISEGCKENLEKLVNEQIQKSLSIPDNVILHNDHYQSIKTTEKDLAALEAEVNELKDVMKMNAVFMNCLTNEWKSYDIQENLNIETASMSVAKQFLDTNLFETEIFLNNTKKILTEK